jgi:hypothetical protein
MTKMRMCFIFVIYVNFVIFVHLNYQHSVAKRKKPELFL